jgi:hypothetical protein
MCVCRCAHVSVCVCGGAGLLRCGVPPVAQQAMLGGVLELLWGACDPPCLFRECACEQASVCVCVLQFSKPVGYMLTFDELIVCVCVWHARAKGLCLDMLHTSCRTLSPVCYFNALSSSPVDKPCLPTWQPCPSPLWRAWRRKWVLTIFCSSHSIVVAHQLVRTLFLDCGAAFVILLVPLGALIAGVVVRGGGGGVWREGYGEGVMKCNYRARRVVALTMYGVKNQSL